MTYESIDVTIRPMNEFDLDRIEYIERKSYANPWDIEILSDIFYHQNVTAKVAIFKSKVIAYNFYSTFDTYIQIINITVMPNKRKRNVATNLMGDLFKADSNNKYPKNIDAWVNEAKIPMLSFLRKHGFRPIGMAKQLFGKDDGILMRFGILNDFSIPKEYEDMLEEFKYVQFE